ncbi:MAG: YdcF family protein [Sulfurovum sp.]|nr:YdcF family protein [Sulfurovum sp.]
MDFVLKKIISMFLMPLPLGVAFIILALLFLYKNKLQKAKLILMVSIIWFFLFSYSPFVNIILHNIESTYPTLHQAPKEIKYIYVLGGGHSTDETQPITSQVNEASVVRLSEGIRLYRQLHEHAKIIVSGYSGLYDPTPHAAMQKKLAIALGVKKEDIILRPGPRDTQEEAIAAKKLLGDEPFILVTSASHMPRAMKFFAQEGLTPIPAPTDHLGSLQYLDYADVFSSNTLDKSRIVFHEILGLLWQKIKGF